jgi:hypothetical protein
VGRWSFLKVDDAQKQQNDDETDRHAEQPKQDRHLVPPSLDTPPKAGHVPRKRAGDYRIDSSVKSRQPDTNGIRIVPHHEERTTAPVSTAYADVKGIRLYHELPGQGEPLVLIHSGLTTIGEMRGWVRPPAKTRRVIAVEMQGHGRTADTDRPLSFSTLGDDVAALLDHLGILASLTERLLVRAYALQLRFPAPPTPSH